MMTKLRIILSLLFLPIFYASRKSNAPQSARRQENHKPLVKIVSPLNNNVFVPGTVVHYAITVSDKEDGESKFDEINTKEILLAVKYVSDAKSLKMTINQCLMDDPPGLAALRTSNC